MPYKCTVVVHVRYITPKCMHAQVQAVLSRYYVINDVDEEVKILAIQYL